MQNNVLNHRNFTFTSNVWIYKGSGAWHFVTLPSDESDVIKDLYGRGGRGFGSIPATVTVGNTTWKTSIFPDSKAGAYILPLKAEARKKETIKVGDTIMLKIVL